MTGMKFSINTARQLVMKEDYRQAITHYLIILSKFSEEQRNTYKAEFLQTLSFYSMQWVQANCVQNDFRSCPHVKETFRNILGPIGRIYSSINVYQSIAETMIQLDLKIEAWRLLASWFEQKHIATMNDEAAGARVMMANLSSCVFDSWHMIMLNNKERNDIYREAIERLPENKLLLEIGSGTGLLSIFAHRKNLDVIAVEENEELANITRNAFVQNNTGNSKMTIVFPCNSKDLNIEEIANKRADVLVSEIFDCNAFGEGIIAAYLDAHNHLIHPETILIPSGFKVFATFVQSSKLHSIHVSKNLITEYVNKYNNFGEEPYWCDHLDKYPDVEFLSEPLLLHDVDLANKEQLKQLVELTTDTFLMNVVKPGTLHAIVVHWQARMGDNLTLHSNMKGSCWEYGIYPLRNPRLVEVDEKIGIKVSLSDRGKRLDIALSEELEEKPSHPWYTMADNYLSLCHEEGFSKEVENDQLFLPPDNQVVVLTPFNMNIPMFENFAGNFVEESVLNKFHYHPLLFSRKSKNVPTDQKLNSGKLVFPIDRLIFWPFYPDGGLHEEVLESYLTEIFLEWEQFYHVCGLEYVPPRITPSFIECHAQLIYSDELAQKSRLQPDSHFGVNLKSDSHPMGLFECRDIYLHCFEHKTMSEIFKPFRFDFQAMLGYDFENISTGTSVKQIECTEDGEVDGILYWWQAKIFNSRNLPCASFVFPKRISVKKNDILDIRCDYFRGNILMSLDRN